MSHPSPTSDRDLISTGEARELARRAKGAQSRLEELTQQQVDAIVEAMANVASVEAAALADLAVQETGYGVAADKLKKNLFAAQTVYDFIRPMKTVGVIRSFPERGVSEIAQPFGVVAAVVPSTNPTSTTIYKILIAVKARCALVVSPHPAAVTCITKTAELMNRAGRAAGLPDGAISWMQTVTLEGTQELMSHRDVALILATGGMGLVRAAYSAGKPAYGVGPGNAPAYIEGSADVPAAVQDIITGKTFDNGVLCSAENSVVVDRAVADEVRREFERQGAVFLSDTESAALARVLVTPQGLPNPALVGKSATEVALAAGLTVPTGTRVLISPLTGVGREYPLSMEKLCPVLSFYEVDDWRGGCERCMEILRYGGMGHTMAIHSRDEAVVMEFGLKKPAFRIVVNSPTTLGSIGMTTGLDPAMTLGCGGFGGNITSDNISPMHLLNIKRLAYGIRPAAHQRGDARPQSHSAEPVAASAIEPRTLARRIDAFLLERGVSSGPHVDEPRPVQPPARPETRSAREGVAPEPEVVAVDFVCEEDVREAVSGSRTIVVDEKTIVTPAARDLAEKHRVFVYAGVSTSR
jgi:acetaldehyde dehydrogenase (acetylating)